MRETFLNDRSLLFDLKFIFLSFLIFEQTCYKIRKLKFKVKDRKMEMRSFAISYFLYKTLNLLKFCSKKEDSENINKS